MAAGGPAHDPCESLARSGARHRSRIDAGAEGAARHGVGATTVQDAEPTDGGARFGRLFPFLPARCPGVDALNALADGMSHLTAAGGAGADNPRIPAGYTYLGQFIDHDITFDPTSRLRRANEPSALVNFRTPRFDLDSLYGAGPVHQPYLYDWCCEHPGAKLLVATDPRAAELACRDLPRNGQGRALIGDARNDENLIISQLHLLLLRFHNAIVDRLCAHAQVPAGALFEQARELVRWHYQWIVAHDFLHKLVGDKTAEAVTPRPMQASAGSSNGVPRLYPWRQAAVIPVEFSAAAYRVGHSMVRSDYRINRDSGPVPILPKRNQGDDPHHLGGFRALRRDLEIEWPRFFFEGGASDPRIASKRMDEYLSEALFRLPLKLTLGEIPSASGGTPPAIAPTTTELARLNLHRGRALGLPAGADVARALGQPPLTPAQLFPEPHYIRDGPLRFVPGVNIPEPAKCALVEATPLWYYILRDAAVHNENGVVGNAAEGLHGVHLNACQLGPVGGRIVAEVLVGLLESDPQSYVNQDPAWTPERCADVLAPFTAADPCDFTMVDLVRFTTAGDA